MSTLAKRRTYQRLGTVVGTLGLLVIGTMVGLIGDEEATVSGIVIGIVVVLIAEVVDPTGRSEQFSYDGRGLVTARTFGTSPPRSRPRHSRDVGRIFGGGCPRKAAWRSTGSSSTS